MSCHSPSGAVTLEAPVGKSLVTVALVGNPNVGKSTLFNALTGARQAVMNAPGTTVELQTGTWRSLSKATDAKVALIDLPGTYSLVAHSPDEQITADALAGAGSLPVPDVALVLLDATALARSLAVLKQVIDSGATVVAAVCMLDVASGRQVRPDLSALALAAGVRVVGIDPRSGKGLSELTRVVAEAIDGDTCPCCASDSCEPDCDCCAADRGAQAGPDDLDAVLDAEIARFDWVERVLAAAHPSHAQQRAVRTLSDRVDRVLLHPAAGIPVFLAVMWAVFQLTTVVAAPLIDGVSGFFDGPVADWLGGWLPGPAWVHGLAVDGVLAGVGTVLSFVPLLALIFVAIGVLEDSGYLARAAFVADRALRTIGLDGRAMVPLVVGFGCNVPAMTATRTMPDARRRLLTGLLVPFTSCPARLVVFVLVAGVFFPDNAGTVVFAMYVLSALLVVLGGLALRSTLFRDLKQGRALAIALPAYQRPRLRVLVMSAWTRVVSFVKSAGGIIAGTLVVVWILTAIPVTGGHQVADVPIHDSAYGRLADGIAPVLAPAGLDDWHISAALTTGFVAKEVVVGALAQSYAVDEPEEGAPAGALGAHLRDTLEASSGGHGVAAALAFMVFVLAYTPCLATVGEQKRVFGAKWTFSAVAVQLAVAWALAALVFQVGRLIW
ncbi:ferrous iron transport protein B [Xylanimonas ulmi]|uniref:Ferrous iron transport protein B n=1 Tax=Xylanimonas ulmi TaxID=228973 RepID=A0A4Q7LY78_9MICO|nr:ferrous iron transport protein B [Xylanibacterium ulmi]RZS60125.1 ferrous iron transport protein B [Xylanibacterium ulmi]